MFLTESFRDYRTTEPIWFRYLRGFFAIALTAAIVFYSIIKIEKLNGPQVYLATNSKLHEFEFNILMCTEDVRLTPTVVNNIENSKINPINQTCQSIQLNGNRSLFSFYIDITKVKDTQQYLFLNFESIQFVSDPDKRPSYFFGRRFNPNLQPIRPKDFQVYRYTESSDFLLNLRQDASITFKPMLIDDKLDLNSRLSQLPAKVQLNIMQINFDFPGNILRFQNSYKATDFIADLGGFYGAIAGVFYLLFGKQKHEPWGLVQKYLLSYISFRQSFTRKFAERYVTSGGLPFVEKVDKYSSKENVEPENSDPSLKEDLEFLKDRVQILEILLKDYYLDDYLLEKVKFAVKSNTKKKDDPDDDVVSWV